MLLIRQVQCHAYVTIGGVLNHDVFSGVVVIDAHSMGSIIIMLLLYVHALLNSVVSIGGSSVTWLVGAIILLLMVSVCFTGYSLSGGTMSY
jgi:quinol-cytochrome oxidoreductase complex cytochrome b subunit